MRFWKVIFQAKIRGEKTPPISHKQPMLESDLLEFFAQVEEAGLVDDVRLSTSHVSLGTEGAHNLTIAEVRTLLAQSENKFKCPNCGYECDISELGGEFDCPICGDN